MCVYISCSISFVFVDIRIWNVDSSIIKRVSCQTRYLIFQTHLELERQQFFGRVRWNEMGEIMPKIKCLLKKRGPTQFPRIALWGQYQTG